MSSLNPFEPGMCATVLSMTASPKGRSVRIGLRRRHTAHKECASLSYDEVRNRDIRVGDTVLPLGEAVMERTVAHMPGSKGFRLLMPPPPARKTRT